MNEIDKKINHWYCYILKNNSDKDINRTYNGYTNKPANRIRQHNGELVGGAKYTSQFGANSWEMYFLMRGFPDSQNALQCEWRIKHPDNKRKRPNKYNSVAGRIIGVNEVLKLNRWTANSKIDNTTVKFEIWILKEYSHLLTNIPSNYIINIVDKIDFNDKL